jgi:hypothetical protein
MINAVQTDDSNQRRIHSVQEIDVSGSEVANDIMANAAPSKVSRRFSLACGRKPSGPGLWGLDLKWDVGDRLHAKYDEVPAEEKDRGLDI